MKSQRALPVPDSYFGHGGAMSLACPPSGRALACFAGEGGFSGGQRGACPPVEAKRALCRLDHGRRHWGDRSRSARRLLPTPFSSTLPFAPDQGRTGLVTRSFSARMALHPLDNGEADTARVYGRFAENGVVKILNNFDTLPCPTNFGGFMARFNDIKGGRMARKITFRLDEKHLEELETCSLNFGASVSFLVRHLVVRFLEDQRRNNPSSVARLGGMP